MSTPKPTINNNTSNLTNTSINQKNKKRSRRRKNKKRHHKKNYKNSNSLDHYDIELEMKKFREKEKNPIGYFMNIAIVKIDSHFDQMPDLTNKCLLYASGFCRFGKKCPNIGISQSAHNAKLLLKKENDWLKYAGNPSNYPVLNSNNNNTKWYKEQLYNYLAVLDLEGLPEITEFPVLLINLNTMKEIGRFHHYVIPQQFIKDKVFDKSNKESDCYNPYSNGLPFVNVLRKFDKWLRDNNVFDEYKNGKQSILFAICGNWDIAKQIPLQCYRCNIGDEFPKYMYQWMNIKDFGLNFYKKAKPKDMMGMASVLKYLKIPLLGTHHSGMDDTSNIARIVVRYIKEGAIICDTARRNPNNVNQIQFRYQNEKRIGWGGNKGKRV